MDLRTGPLGGAQQWEWWKTCHPGPHADTNNWLSVTPPPGTTAATARRALDLLSARHESLRTAIEIGADGVPRQVVRPPAPVVPRVHRFVDEAGRAAFQETLRWHEFVLDTEPPFLTGLVLDPEGDRVREMMGCLPHVVVDGWSRRILIRDLTEITEALVRGREPGLPPAAQPLDVADDAGTHVAAQRFWHGQFETMPNRMFASAPDTAPVLVSADYSSALAPLVLAGVARRDRVGPSVVYLAALHALLACFSGTGRSVLRTHFSGRDSALDGVVGCFHRVLPIAVDLADRPPLSEIIRRTWTKSLRAQSRYQLDYLELAEARAAAGARRGVVFADGTTVNFAPGRDDLAGLDEAPADVPSLLALADRPDTAQLHYFAPSDSLDEWGMDAYLQIRFRGPRMSVGTSFNAAVFTRAQMLALLGGPERLLLRYLERGDVPFADVADTAGVPDGPVADPDVAEVRGGLVRLGEVVGLLRRHEEVADARVVAETAETAQPDAPELVAYVTPAPGASRLDEAQLRDFVLARLDPVRPAACPDRFVIAPTAQQAPVPGPVPAPGPGSRALFEAIDAFGAGAGFGALNPDTSYLDAGGELTKVPAILRELADHGYSGLVPDDFLRPVPVRVLAAMVVPR